VLAAGMGSRYGGSKQTAGVGPADEWLLDYAIYDGLHAGFRDIVLVIKPGAQADFAAVQERWGARLKIRLAEQRPDDLPSWFQPPPDRTKPWGTGHAVLAVRDHVTSPFAVINADDYYGREAYELAHAATARARDRGEATIVGMRLEGTLSEHGAVTRAVVQHRDGVVTRVTEVSGVARTKTGFTPPHLTGGESVSMNFWVFPTRIFELFQGEFDLFLRQEGQDIKAEFLLPTVVNTLISRGELTVHLDQAPGPWLGLTHASDRERVAGGLRRMAESGHYPIPLWRF
jgi:UTP-glucose-1-phosphate uridylyltransferase